MCLEGCSIDSGHLQRRIACRAWASWKGVESGLAAIRMSVDGDLLGQRCSTLRRRQELIRGVPYTQAGTIWTGSARGHEANAVDLWTSVLRGATGLTVNDSSCRVKDRLDTASLIFWHSLKDAISVVDPTDDERFDDHLCRVKLSWPIIYFKIVI